MLHLLRARVRNAIGGNDSVHAEVLVGRNVDGPEITAVSVIDFVGLFDVRLVEIDEELQTVAGFAFVEVLTDLFRRQRSIVNARRADERADDAIRMIRVASDFNRIRRFGDAVGTFDASLFLAVDVKNQLFAGEDAGDLVPVHQPLVDFSLDGDPS